MSFIVIAIAPEGGGCLESTHGTLDAAEKHAEHLNRLPLPFSYVVVERTS